MPVSLDKWKERRKGEMGKSSFFVRAVSESKLRPVFLLPFLHYVPTCPEKKSSWVVVAAVVGGIMA